MGWLEMIDRAPVTSNVRFVVEDPRSGSGHMQRCYPAPANGFFEAAIELGQPVVAGQCLGYVVDPLGDARMEVQAAETGHVLALRTFSAVRQGDSLAVILETVE
jgi:predicted deacylase